MRTLPIAVHKLFAVAVFVALLPPTVWLLYALAQSRTNVALCDVAAHALALAATGSTPYHWNFSDSEDVVAGRVFDARDYAFRDGELAVESDGRAFEVGLPLARPVDMQRFPHLFISATVDAPAELRFVVRKRLDAPERNSEALVLSPDTPDRTIDLATLIWTEQARTVLAPDSAAMLRLRVRMAAGHALHLRSVALNRIDGAQAIDLTLPASVIAIGAIAPADSTRIYRLTPDARLQASAIDSLAKSIGVHSTPLILLPQSGRVEQQLQLRNAILAALPAAIPIPANAVDATFARARTDALPSRPPLSPFAAWLALAIFAVILAVFRLCPPPNPRFRALVEIVLVMVAPLWLILGKHFDGNPDAWQLSLIGLALVYAISLSWPRQWHWNGSARAWLFSIAIIALAAIIGLIGHDPDTALRTIGSGHIARYLAWALLQQYLVCAVCTERWRIVTGNTLAAMYLGALGFALMHTPNATLMLATFAGGLGWCALYLRERALLPLAASHAASALLLLTLLPADILLSAEVGVRFLR